MIKQPKSHSDVEALRLADALTADDFGPLTNEAAAELRRLYWAELGVREHRDQMCKEVTRLHSLNSELLNALASVKKLTSDEIDEVYFRVLERLNRIDLDVLANEIIDVFCKKNGIAKATGGTL